MQFRKTPSNGLPPKPTDEDDEEVKRPRRSQAPQLYDPLAGRGSSEDSADVDGTSESVSDDAASAAPHVDVSVSPSPRRLVRQRAAPVCEAEVAGKTQRVPRARSLRNSSESPSGEEEELVEEPKVPSTTDLVGSFADNPSLLNVKSLAELFRTFHGKIEGQLRKESTKLVEMDAVNLRARRSVQEAYDSVSSFLEEFVPESDLSSISVESLPDETQDREMVGGGRPSKRRKAAKTEQEHVREHFTTRLLPKFLKYAADDHCALQDASDLLGSFVQAHFPENKEVAAILEVSDGKSNTVRLFQTVLRVLVSELGVLRQEKLAGAKPSHEARSRGLSQNGAERQQLGRGQDRAVHRERGEGRVASVDGTAKRALARRENGHSEHGGLDRKAVDRESRIARTAGRVGFARDDVDDSESGIEDDSRAESLDDSCDERRIDRRPRGLEGGAGDERVRKEDRVILRSQDRFSERRNGIRKCESQSRSLRRNRLEGPGRVDVRLRRSGNRRR